MPHLMYPSGLKAAGARNWLYTLEVSFILRQYVILEYESNINIFFFGETHICIRPSAKLKESGQPSVICLLNKRCGFWETQITQQNALSRKKRHRNATAALPQRHRSATNYCQKCWSEKNGRWKNKIFCFKKIFLQKERRIFSSAALPERLPVGDAC